MNEESTQVNETNEPLFSYLAILGVIIGDIIGSSFEFNNINVDDIYAILYNGMLNFEPPFGYDPMKYTDDTVLTLAIAKAFMEFIKEISESKICDEEKQNELLKEKASEWMLKLGRQFATDQYGSQFRQCIQKGSMVAYGSCGNGAPMRISAIGFMTNNLKDAKRFTRVITDITHNHEESETAAEAVVIAILFSRCGWKKDEIKYYIKKHYYPEYFTSDFTLEKIYDSYRQNYANKFPDREFCINTVPQAFEIFFEAEDFNDTIIKAIKLGGDTDTIAAIAGSMAAAYYGIEEEQYRFYSDTIDEFLRAESNYKKNKGNLPIDTLCEILGEVNNEYLDAETKRIPEENIDPEIKELHEEVKNN